MSYSLTPIVVDLQEIKALLGSKNTEVLQAVIKKYRKEMIDTDGMGDFFDEFEREIKREYKAFVAGDFSGVDLKANYPEPKEEDVDPEDERKLSELMDGVGKLDPDAPGSEKKFAVLLRGFFRSDRVETEDEEEDEVKPVKEVTTGAALAHLIMGGNPDRSLGYKYGYALSCLCEYLGEIPDHDSWCTIRYRSLEAIDALLKKAGVSPRVFSASKFLVERGSPVPIPQPDNFPSIGYLTRDEVRKVLAAIDPRKVEMAIRRQPADHEWYESAIGELRCWLELCTKINRDLICFYY